MKTATNASGGFEPRLYPSLFTRMKHPAITLPKAFQLALICVFSIWCNWSFAQNSISLTPVVPPVVNVAAASGQAYYNVYVFEVNAPNGGQFDGQINLSYSNIIPSSSNLHALQEVRLYTGLTSPFPSSGTVFLNDPNTSINASNSYVEPSVDPGNFMNGASFFTVNNQFDLSGNGVLDGQKICIVEKYRAGCSSVVPNVSSTSHFTFSDPGFFSAGYSTIDVSHNFNLEAEQQTLTSLESRPVEVFTGIPSVQHYLTNPAPDCEVGQEITRRIRLNVNQSSIKDPSFNVELGAPSQLAFYLLEVNPADVRIEFKLETEIGVLQSPANMTLEDIYAASANNYLFQDYTRLSSNGVTGSNASSLPNAAPYGAPTNLVTNCTYTGPHPKENYISFTPSLASPSTSPEPIFADMTINLHKIAIDNNGTIIPPNSFSTIFAGSYIEIEYKGTLVSQDNFDTDWESWANDVPTGINNQRIGITGCTSCSTTLTYSNAVTNGLSGIWGITQPLQAQVAESNGSPVSSMLGDNAPFGDMMWDGDAAHLIINPASLSWGGGTALPASLEIDPACSKIQFVVEMEAGLSVPCTGDGVSLFVDPCLPVSNALGGCGSVLSASDVFYIELIDGTQIPASAVIVEPSNAGNCLAGQRWITEFPLSDFIGATAPGNTVWDIDLLGSTGTEIHIAVQSYCPASEPTTAYSIASYLIPGSCQDNQQGASFSFNSTAETILNQDFHRIQCSTSGASCMVSDCDQDRFLLGKADAAMEVTCPGCITPGAFVSPNNVLQQRHADFVGFADANDDGIRDDFFANIEADSLLVRRDKVKHGDVMTIRMGGNFFNGQTLSSTGDAFTVMDLSNPPAACNGIAPAAINLSTYGVDIVAENASSGFLFSQMFCPLIQGAPASGNALKYNDDLINENGMNTYTNMAGQYASHVAITNQLTNETQNLVLTDNHVAWYDEKTFRIAIDVSDVNTLPWATNPNVSYFSENLKMEFVLQFVTDVDINPRNWPTLTTQTDCLMKFDYLPFTMGASVDDILGLSGNPVPEIQYYNEELFCQSTENIGYWCEGGSGIINVVPYIEDRVMNYTFTSLYGTYSDNQVTAIDDLSPCAERAPKNVYRAGTIEKTGGGSSPYSDNHFPFEIRQPALPDSIVFYLPQPFTPEAIVLENHSLLNPQAYIGGDGGSGKFIAVLPLVGENSILSTGNNYNIQITTNVIPPTDFIPKYPTDPTALQAPLPFGITPGDPVLNPSALIPHTRIALPIEMMFDPADFSAAFAQSSHLVSSNELATVMPGSTTGFPLFVADEYFQLTFTLLYNMPGCSTPGTQSDHTPYDVSTSTLECDHYAENQSPIYFDGNSINFLTLFAGGTNNQTVKPVTATPSPTDFQFVNGYPTFHPDYETPITYPACVQTAAPVNSLTTSTISSKVSGVDNHPLDFSSYSGNSSVQTQLENLFSGAVPAYGSYGYNLMNGLPLEPNVPHLYFDQRADLTVSDLGNSQISVNSATGEFSFNFDVRNEVPNGLQSFVAPCLGYTYDNFVSQIGLTPSQVTTFNRFAPLFKRNQDIDNMYFYLEKISGSALDLSQDVVITSVEKNSTSLPSGYLPLFDFTNTFDQTTVFASENSTTPRLFELGKVAMASYDNGLVVNENVVHTITVHGKFNCERDAIQQAILTSDPLSGPITLPFNIVVNYNCDRDWEAWKETNYLELLGVSSPSVPPVEELTFTNAMDTRCHNDELENFDFSLDPILYEIVTNDVSADLCNPVMEVSVNNLQTGAVYLNEMVLSNLPVGLNAPSAPAGWTLTTSSSPWVYTFDANNNSPATDPDTPYDGLSNNYSFILDFGNVGCISPFTFDVEMNAFPYCSDCQSDPACQVTTTTTAQFNYGIGNPGNPMIDFTNIDVFNSTGCVNMSSPGVVEVLMSGVMSNGSDIDYSFDFTISDGVNTCSGLMHTWNSQNNWINPEFTCAIDVCNGVTVTLNTVQATVDCGANCNLPVQIMGQSCQTPATPTPDLNVPADVTSCDSYTLPAITGTNLSGNEAYYDNSQAGNGQLITNTTLSGNQTVWIYDFNGSCSDEVSFDITIVPSPNAGTLTGNSVICVNSTTPITSNGNAGGTWNSSNTSVATVDVNGNVTGVAAGVAIITYTVAAAWPCEEATSSMQVEVVDFDVVAELQHLCEKVHANGQINLNVSPSTLNYTYQWSGSNIPVPPNSLSNSYLENLYPGIYDVEITTGNGCTFTSSYEIVELNVSANFSSNLVAGTECTFEFANTSTATYGTVISTIWDFGDGSTASGANAVTHTYNTPGPHTACLEVIYEYEGTECSDVFCMDIGPCVDCSEQVNADFAIIPATPDNEFGFTDFSSSNGGTLIGNYVWDWGDGTTSSYPVPGASNPPQSYTHSYAVSGIYTVCLTVTYQFPEGERCTQTACSTLVYCNEKPDPECANVDFNAFQQTGSLDVAFNSFILPTSFTATSYNWFFGHPGGFGTGASITHTFPNPGTYDVSLIVSGSVNEKRCTICETKSQQVNQVKEKRTESKLQIIPNPSNGRFTVFLDDSKSGEDVIIKVTNALGATVHYEMHPPKAAFELQLNVGSGIYFVEILGDDIHMSKRLIIN